MAQLSKLDQQQIIQSVYDEPSNSLRTLDSGTGVISVTGQIECIIDHVSDSIALGTSAQLFTGATGPGGRFGLDTNILNPISGDFSPKGLSVAILPTRLVLGATALPLPATPLTARNSISIRNLGPNVMYVGNSSVAASNGYPKYKDEEVICDIRDSVLIYGVCDIGATTNVAILELA